MLATRRSQLIVIWVSAALLVLFVIAAGDGTNHENVKSASSSTLDKDDNRTMELTSIRQDGTEYCVSLAATGKHRHQVAFENCGPTAVNLVYDDLSSTLDSGETKTVTLDYDYTEFSVDIEALDGEFIGGFQP